MSVMGLAGFAQGFADMAQHKKDQARIDADNARKDRWLDIVEKNPGILSASYGLPVDGGVISGSGGGGGAGSPGPASSGGASGGIFGLIDKHEGGGNYDTLYGHSQNGGKFDGVKVSEMTIGEVLDFANPSGEYGQWVKGKVGRVATPMGRHQIVGTTLRSAVEGMGLSPDTKFTPQVQDSIANYLAKNRLAGLKSPAAKRAAMRAEWEGFKNVSDADLDAAIEHFEMTQAMGPRPMGIGVQ